MARLDRPCYTSGMTLPPPIPLPYRVADPIVERSRSRLVELGCWAVIVIAIVFSLLSYATAERSRALLEPNRNQGEPNLQMLLTSRVAIGQKQLLKTTTAAGKTAATGSAMIHPSTTHPSTTHPAVIDTALTNTATTNPVIKAAAGDTTQSTLDALRQLAVTPADKISRAVMVAELQGTGSAIDALQEVGKSVPASSVFADDAKALTRLYRDGPTKLAESDRSRIKSRLGWFGALALTQGLPADAPERASILHQCSRLFVLLSLGGLGGLAAFVAGLVLLTVGIVFTLNQKLQFRSVPHFNTGGVFLESFAIWMACYFFFSWSLTRLMPNTPVLVHEVFFVAMTIAVACWPLLRGISWTQLRDTLGWYPGKSIFVEMGAGVIGYLAGLPLLAIAMYATTQLGKWGHTQASHPIVKDLLHDNSAGQIWAVFLSASVLAPLLEETMFRGAFYAHLRRRWRPFAAALVVSVVFAAIHPQGWSGVPVLASIAMILATLREWRGSLVASMTAHAINNTVMLVLLVGVVS